MSFCIQFRLVNQLFILGFILRSWCLDLRACDLEVNTILGDFFILMTSYQMVRTGELSMKPVN